MKLVQIDEIAVNGISVRTKNSDEMRPETSKEEIVPNLKDDSTIFAAQPGSVFLLSSLSWCSANDHGRYSSPLLLQK